MSVPPAPAERVELRDPIQVTELVGRFYQAVAQDGVLGPIFEGMGVDWAAHLPTMVDFWCDRLLGIPGYQGNPVAAHQPVLDRFPFGDAEIDRWLELWTETVEELFIGEGAAWAVDRAHLAAMAIRTLARRHAGTEAPAFPLVP
jgi:hemoglobin